MSKDINKGKLPKWYKRWEIWGTITLVVFSSISLILMMFPDVGNLYRIGAILGVVVGLIKSIIGIILGYKSNNLSDSITKVLDKIPDKITGTKGELIK